MAEDFLEAIYKEAGILCKLRKIVQYIKVYDDFNSVLNYNEMLTELRDCCERYVNQDKAKGMELWGYLQEASNIASDLIFLGDLLESRVLPLLEESMRQWGDIRTENEEGDYLFESTVSGFLTIKDLQEGVYLHSKVDPMWEAEQIAEGIYKPSKGEYSVRGCGLGYLAYQLYDISLGTAIIRIFEKDARMVEYARQYGVLDWIPKENLKIIVEESPMPFIESGNKENVVLYLYGPQQYRESADTRTALENWNAQYNKEESKDY